MPTKMTTLKPLVYAGRSMVPGEEFDSEERDVQTLTVTGFAVVDPQAKVEPETRPEAPAESRHRPGSGRQYRRRDMRSER